MKAYVLDSSALLAFLEQERGAEIVERVLNEASHRKAAVWMTTVNLGEVFYVLWRSHGEQRARVGLSACKNMPITYLMVDSSVAEEAAAIKAVSKLPYADSFVAMLAQRENATIVCKDADFKMLGPSFNILQL